MKIRIPKGTAVHPWPAEDWQTAPIYSTVREWECEATFCGGHSGTELRAGNDYCCVQLKKPTKEGYTYFTVARRFIWVIHED